MKRKNILALALFAGMSVQGMAQTKNITGFVKDAQGNPVTGAMVTVEGNPERFATTAKDGSFTLVADKAENIVVTTASESQKTVTASVGAPVTIVMDKWTKPITVDYDKIITLGETSASVSTVDGATLAKRAGRDITTSMYGYLPGMISLQTAGTYANRSTKFYVRGLHSLTTNSPLVMVDGVERDASYITPEEVESVNVLKDAAAVALYGYRGVDGVINIVTKRGKYNSREINFKYDHIINFQSRKPKFVDAFTYANAYNEALKNEGVATPKYNANELNAFRTGKYPYLYPNVNWMDEVFKNTAATNLYTIDFRGGGNKFRYYTLVDLQVDKGFVKNANMNEGYSTNNKYSRGTLRTNLDIDLTNNTKLAVNLSGSLSESSKPGNSANLWNMIYTLPSAAIPVKLEDGTWAGNSTWAGTSNPVAQAQGAGYTKQHIRALYADMTLKQDFSSILPGLSGSLRLAYDNLAAYLENHSKTYVYNAYQVTGWNENGEPNYSLLNQQGSDSELGTSSSLSTFRRNFNFAGTVGYDQTFGDHSLYTQLRWDYQYTNSKGNGNTYYRQNVSWFAHYGFKQRYYLDLNMVGSASSHVAPGHKWAFSPTVSAAWLINKESFLKDVQAIDLLKLRASAGIINSDYIPGDDYWEQKYQAGGYYSFGSDYTTNDQGGFELGALIPSNITHEKAYKYNVGVDLGLFKSLNVSLEGWYERRSDMWVDASGKYTAVVGQDAPHENAGIMNSWGLDLGVDYTKQVGEVTLNAGVSFSWQRNKVVEKLEAPTPYPNMVTTGEAYGQWRGLKAIGLFKDQADIDASPKQSFGTVYPGDIKYEDVNNDGKIDANDEISMGYNTTCPEIYYSFHLGAEWRGLGIDAMFQGAAKYTGTLTTSAMYRPLLASTSLSQYYYDNRWTESNPNAKFPRLASQASTNNYRNSTLWMQDRSFLKLRNVEVYYKFPKSLLKHLKIMNSAKLYVRGVDLFSFDKMDGVADPESYGISEPIMKSVIAGLQIGF